MRTDYIIVFVIILSLFFTLHKISSEKNSIQSKIASIPEETPDAIDLEMISQACENSSPSKLD